MSSYELKKGWLMAFLIAFFLSGCAGLEIAATNQTIIVNRDLSGTFSRSIALLPTDYDRIAAQMGLSNPSEYIAQDIAEVLGWTSYTSDHWQEDGYDWVSVAVDFSSPEELYAVMGAVLSDQDWGQGGAQGAAGETNEKESPSFEVSKTKRFFHTEYRLQGTLIALQATGAPIYEASFHSQLPGRIVEEETNGRILEDGKTVAWNWGRFDYVPFHHVTRTTRFGRVFAAIIIIGGFAVNVMGAVGVLCWQQQNHLNKV